MNKKIILWVEDEPEFQNIRVRRLKREVKDVEILFAKNPVEAMRKLDLHKDNILGVILDFLLPSGERTSDGKSFNSGIKLAKYICDKYPHVKIVGLTNLSKYTHIGRETWAELEKISCIKEIIEKTAPISEFVNSIIYLMGDKRSI